MSYLPKRISTIVCFTFLLAATAATASTQQAHFRLPFEAKWGTLVLPPGDYTIQAPQLTTTQMAPEVIIRGPVVGIVMTVASDAYGGRVTRTRDNEYLQLTKVGGVFCVTEYHDGSEETNFYFRAPKPGPEDTASREVVNIPVGRT